MTTRVAQSEVLRAWLTRERRKRGRDPPPSDADPDAMLDELLGYQPGTASTLWRDAPFQWAHVLLDRHTFSRIRVAEGPPDLGWRRLASDGRVMTVGERLTEFDAATDAPVDSPGLNLELLDQHGDSAISDPLIITTLPGCVPLYLADGNHRAVAFARSIHNGRPYQPVPAYVGVGTAPVFARLRERICGLCQRLLPGKSVYAAV